MSAYQPDYLLGEQKPKVAQRLAVIKGVYWMRMPMPFALNHINLWHLPDAQDGALIDCGIYWPPIEDAWRILFQDPALKTIQHVVATHFHPDHVGMAAMLCRHFAGAQFHMSLSDYTMAHLSCNKAPRFNAQAEKELFQQHGLVDPLVIDAFDQRDNYYKRLVPELPPQFARLRHGETLRLGEMDWQLLVGYGHSPEHMALYAPSHKVLISGDMILPRISTNVAVHAYAPDDDPLAEFLQSIAKFRALPDDTLVLPSHGQPFYGLHGRIAELEAHHASRLAALLELARQKPLTAYNALPVLFSRPITDTHNLYFALGESLAHLNHLWQRGDLRREFDGQTYQFCLRTA